MKVAELKEVLRALGLPVSGNKPQLIQRLQDHGYTPTKRLHIIDEASGRRTKRKIDRQVDPSWLPPSSVLLDILMSNEAAMKHCSFNTRTNMLCVSKLWNEVGKRNFSGIFKFNFPLKMIQAYCATSKDKIESDFQILKQQNQNIYHHGLYPFMPPAPVAPAQPTRYQLLSRVFEFSPVQTIVIHLKLASPSGAPVTMNLCFGVQNHDLVCFIFNQHTLVHVFHDFQTEVIPLPLEPNVLPVQMQSYPYVSVYFGNFLLTVLMRKDKIKWWDRFPFTDVAKHTLVTCTMFGETVKHYFKENIHDAAQVCDRSCFIVNNIIAASFC